MHPCCFSKAQKGTGAQPTATLLPSLKKTSLVLNSVPLGDKDAHKDSLMKVREPLLLPQYMEEDQSVYSTSSVNYKF